MAFDWREALKGGMMSPEQFSKYQDRQYEGRKTEEQRNFDILKMIYSDELAGKRGEKLAIDDNLYKGGELTKDSYLDRSRVPYWVPRGKESSYEKAKAHYSDDEIKAFLKA